LNVVALPDWTIVSAAEKLETMIRVGAFDGIGESQTRQFWQAQHLLKGYVLYSLRAEWYKHPRDPNDEKVAVSWQKRFGRGVALLTVLHPDSALSDFGRGHARVPTRRL
jgi:hypothetical protein